MNKVLMMTVMMVLGSMLYAQQGPPDQSKGDRIEALRIAFISERLALTPAEAQTFWPVYNQYRADMDALRKNFKQGPDVKLTAEQQLDFEQKKLDLKKKYKNQFEGALGRDKVNQLYNLESEFHQKLKELRDQRQQQKGGGQGPPPNGGQRGNGRQ
ncbi:MAG TPA: hypothetical protein VK154_03225 [Chitinophagales bacterium]|nr:hypothetical protein [Chitinophagales bacterium]